MSKTHQEHGDKGYVEDQRDFFDNLITADWDTYESPLWDHTRRLEIKQIMKRIATPKQVLDVGCGAGFHDVVYAEYQGVERVVGVDYSEKSIQQANTHYPHPKVERFVADVFDDQWVGQHEGQFDLVSSFQVIEHLTNPETFLRQCARLTKDSGYIAVVTPNAERIQNRYLNWRGSPSVFIDPLHFDEYTKDSLTQIGEACGLTRVGYAGHSMFFSIRGYKLITPQRPLGVKLGQWFPRAGLVMDVIFQKRA